MNENYKNKDFAWQLFKNTGNVDAFMIMKACELGEEITPNLENQNILGVSDGNNKNQGDCN